MPRRFRPLSFVLGILSLVGSVLSPQGGHAQSMTAAEIEAMIDQRMNDLNPYQELLNDPDPARSLAAMQIMLESEDRDLIRMAMEYGMLSPNPTVQRTAFESFLTTRPIFSIRFDGSEVEDNSYPSTIGNYWNGTLAGDKTGYWRIATGAYLSEKQCFTNTYDDDECFLTVNSDGVFFTPNAMNGRATIAEDGTLTGVANLYAVDDPVPFTVQLID